jgi:hypothetical protein
MRSFVNLSKVVSSSAAQVTVELVNGGEERIAKNVEGVDRCLS